MIERPWEFVLAITNLTYCYTKKVIFILVYIYVISTPPCHSFLLTELPSFVPIHSNSLSIVQPRTHTDKLNRYFTISNYPGCLFAYIAYKTCTILGCLQLSSKLNAVLSDVGSAFFIDKSRVLPPYPTWPSSPSKSPLKSTALDQHKYEKNAPLQTTLTLRTDPEYPCTEPLQPACAVSASCQARLRQELPMFSRLWIGDLYLLTT